MSQNTSSAVMQQRIEAHDSLDDFPTPPWATRALIQHCLLRFMPMTGKLRLRQMIVREPTANRGHMARPLAEYFKIVDASDIMDYGKSYPVDDYLFPGPMSAAEWTIFNPPFNLAKQFILRSFETPGWIGTAALVRGGFIEGAERYETLFRDHPPAIEAHFVERVIMNKGILRDPNRKYWDAERREYRVPSTATAYTWLIWMKTDWDGCRSIWIPPCRKTLERPGDYPDPPQKPEET